MHQFTIQFNLPFKAGYEVLDHVVLIHFGRSSRVLRKKNGMAAVTTINGIMT